MNAKTVSAGIILFSAFTSCVGGNSPKKSDAAQAKEALAFRREAGPVAFTVAEGWEAVPVKSSVRLAQYHLPKSPEDQEGGEIVVYYFGASQGGSSQANLDRWISQMEQSDGKDSKGKAKIDAWEQRGLRLTRIDLAGTYVAETAPGSGERLNKPGWRMIASVVETGKGPVFFKAVGPEKTISRWESGISELLKSVSEN